MNFDDFSKIFPTDFSAITFYLNHVNKGFIDCPHCNCIHKFYPNCLKSIRTIRFFKCKKCKKVYSIFSGTIFFRTSTNIRIWFFLIYAIYNTKTPISVWHLRMEFGGDSRTYARVIRQIKLGRLKPELNDFYNAIINLKPI